MLEGRILEMVKITMLEFGFVSLLGPFIFVFALFLLVHLVKIKHEFLCTFWHMSIEQAVLLVYTNQMF